MFDYTVRYPGQVGPASVDYPFGEPQNVTIPGDGTGTPWEADLLRDMWGNMMGLLDRAGTIPSGVAETAANSQLNSALFTLLATNIENAEDILTGVYSESVLIVAAQYNSLIGECAATWKATGNVVPGSAGTTDFANGLLYDSVGTEFIYADEFIYVEAMGNEVQNAIDFASASGRPREVRCGNQTVNTTIIVRNNVHFTGGRVSFNGVVTNIPVLQMGDNAAGVALTRTAKISWIRVKDDAALAGTIAFQIGNYVRSSNIIHCVAEMSEPVNGSLGQVGFEIASWYIGAPGITNAGTYGNVIESCLVLFAHTGFRVRTFGTMAQEIADPQANGNFIKSSHAVSCRRRAAYLSYGAQENKIEVRADTFPNQIGLGTTVNVLDIDGKYNEVSLKEEVGSIADTQYTVRLGTDAIYNDVVFSTQQVVTAAIDDSASPVGKRAKNILRQNGPALISRGRAGSEGTEGFYMTVAANQVQAVQKIWIAPAKCVVTRVSGRLNATAPTGGDTQIYFAKNSAFATNNRVSWAASEAVSVKSITTDTSASVDIGSQWTLNEGDLITMAVTTPSGGGVTATATFFVRYI